MRTLSTCILVALVGAAILGSAMAKPPGVREDDDKFVLQNDLVSVWFQGKKPLLKVMPADVAGDARANNTTLGYEYHFMNVVEYRDLDANGAPSNNEVVGRLKLNSASDWNVERSESDGNVVLNLTLEAPVQLGKDAVPQNVSLPNADARISLVFTIYAQETLLNASGLNVTVPANAVKYDFVVSQWPFVDGANRLALETLVMGELEMEEGEGVDSAVVAGNSSAVGALTWTTTAQGVLRNGSAVEVPVVTTIAAEGEGQSRVVYTYDVADLQTLVHDPTVGLSPEATGSAGAGGDGKSPVPLGPGVVLVALVAAGLVLRRK